MKRNVLLLVVMANLLGITIALSAAGPTLQNTKTVYAQTGNSYVYLPFVMRNDELIQSPVLKNGSFEEGWTDLPPAPGWLINQQPNSWILSWLQPGQPLYDLGATSYGVPEAIHKLDWQLPPNEQLGQPGALILDGSATYKVFHFAAPFGAELKQTLTGLTPGPHVRLTVPVLLDHHNASTDPWGAASGVWVNGQGGWVFQVDMGQRNWYTHTVDAVVPYDGQLEIVIRFATKWVGVDFFIDDVQLQVVGP